MRYSLDVGLCELDTADGPYNKTGYRLEHRTAATGPNPTVKRVTRGCDNE